MRPALTIVLAVAIVTAVYAARRSGDEPGTEDRGAVTLVGDSLSVGTEPYLRDALRGWTIDAHDRVGRATEEGVAVLRERRGALASVVVVSLGTNDPEGSEARFAELVDDTVRLVGLERCLVWATIVRDGTPRADFNRVLERARSDHRNVRLVEWADLVEADPRVLAADLVHGTPEGYARRAEITARAVRDCPRP